MTSATNDDTIFPNAAVFLLLIILVVEMISCEQIMNANSMLIIYNDYVYSVTPLDDANITL